ncbi:MAG: MFS transporter, partial [Nocardioides sp.]
VAVRAMTGRVRWRVLLAANGVFAASYVVLLGASRVGVALGVVMVLLGAAVYTLGELLGGPVHGALSAEAAPEHLRGRYLALIQLAWNVAGAVAPLSFAWLLDRGPSTLWLGMLVVALVGALLVARLGAAMPHAAARVTNAAEPEPVPA